jgi:hypothetical protein
MRLTSLWFGEAPSCDDLATARNCDLGLQYFTLDPYVNRAYRRGTVRPSDAMKVLRQVAETSALKLRVEK